MLRILVTNLTQDLRTISIPSQNGKIYGHSFRPGETLDIATFSSPWLLNQTGGDELRALAAATPPKVRIVVLPDPTDPSQNSLVQTGGIETIDSVRFDRTFQPVLILRQITAGSFIEAVSVFIETAFNDPTAYATIGTYADPQAYLTVNGQGMTKTGSYVNQPIVPILYDDFLILSTNFGASTQGAAYAFFRVRNSL